LAKKNRETEEATEDFEDFKNQFEKSPEEIMISEQEEKKIIDTVAKMDAGYQKIIQLRFFEEKASKKLQKIRTFRCQYQSKNYESQKSFGRIVKRKRVKSLADCAD
jgi:hypothetical protein